MKSSITSKTVVGSGRKQGVVGQIAQATSVGAYCNTPLQSGFSTICPTPKGFVRILLFFVLVFGGGTISAQSVPVYTWDTFEKFLKPESDTVYVINFWATWCKPCVEELPYFEKLTENYKDKKVKVLLVNIDFRSQYDKKVVPFVQKNKLQSQVMMLDTQGDNDFIDKVNKAWQGTIPATVVIQASSGTNKFYEKQFTYDQLETIVKPLIKM